MLKEQLAEAMQQAMEPKIEDAEDGPVELPKDTYYDGGEYLYAYEAEQADVDAVQKLIESADTHHQYNWGIQNIIDEEAQAYFDGECDVDTAIGRMENRITIYLQEQM